MFNKAMNTAHSIWPIEDHVRTRKKVSSLFFHQRDRGRDADAERGNGVQRKLEEAVE